MRFVIVTGMSGAGKSSVLNMLEDSGFFCVDNLPLNLIPTFMQLTMNSAEKIEKVALGLDIRSGEMKKIKPLIESLKSEGFVFEIIFIDASTPVIVKRYKETRRLHPLHQGGRVDNAIEKEREQLVYLKENANFIIDTSNLLIRELKQQIDKIFIGNEEYTNINITFVSFGFKYGIPSDADLLFDVRFLPNPFYEEELKLMTGNEKKVYDFVMNTSRGQEFFNKLTDMLEFLIPNYIIEGKNHLVVAIGCTGGKHRSVAITNAAHDKFLKSEYGCKKEHRDIEKDRLRGLCHFQER